MAAWAIVNRDYAGCAYEGIGEFLTTLDKALKSEELRNAPLATTQDRAKQWRIPSTCYIPHRMLLAGGILTRT